MKRFGVLFSLLCLLAGLFGGCQPSFQPGAYTDDLNRSVSFNETPKRIVAYGPSITEIIYSLGLEEKLVGVDSLSNYPEAAKSKQQVGDAFNPSMEKLVELKPDLVLTVKQQQFNKNMDDLGIKYMVIDPKDLAGTYKDIALIGKITGVEGKSGKIIDDMKATVARVQGQVKNAPVVKTIFLIDTTDLNNPWTAGPGSFIDELITMAGGTNVAAKASAPYVAYSIEQIIAADPEVIILPDQYVVSPQVLKDHPAWKKTSAVKNNRVITVNGDIISRAGPRLAQGLEAVAKIIHPELYK